jgi:hypothetical protein
MEYQEPILNYLVISISKKFRTFGGGDKDTRNNPIAVALRDKPLQFAVGVDVKEVIEFILNEID